MAKSTAPSDERGKRGPGGRASRGRARRTTRRRVAPSAAAPAAPGRGQRKRSPEPAAESAQPVVQEAAVTPPRDPAPGRGEPAAATSLAAPAEAIADQPARAAAKLPEPAAAEPLFVPPPSAVATASLALADAVASAPGGRLLEGATRIQSELLAYGRRQAERNLATGQAMVASGSLPEMLALQAAWLGGTFEDALRHGIALGRVASDLLRLASVAPRG